MSDDASRRLRGRFAILALTGIVIAVMLSACGSSSSSASSDSSSSDSSGSGSEKVAVLFIGSKNDGGFSQAIYEGGLNAAKQDNVSVQSVGNLVTPAQYLAQGTSFAQAGYKLVVLGHGAMGPVAIQLAKQFPETKFCVPNVPPEENMELPENVCFFYPSGEIGAFRAGILAGLVTKTNVIASNQGFEFPGITAQTQAFALGAECVNSKIKEINTLVSSDTDPAATKSATESQIAKGADVILGTTSAMPGLFEASAEAGIYAIGQYIDASSLSPTSVLASSIVNLQQMIPLIVKEAQEEKLPVEQTFALESPIPVGILKLNPQIEAKLPKEALQKNEELQQEVTEGKFKIPTFTEIGTIGSYEKIDVKSLGCSPSAS